MSIPRSALKVHEHLNTIIKSPIPHFCNTIANSSFSPQSAQAVHKSRKWCSKFPSSLNSPKNKAARIVHMRGIDQIGYRNKDNFKTKMTSKGRHPQKWTWHQKQRQPQKWRWYHKDAHNFEDDLKMKTTSWAKATLNIKIMSKWSQ